MTGYKTREVAELVGMSPPRIRAYARIGIVHPARGPRRAFYFTFQDLVLLRTAKRLEEANLPVRRVHRVLQSLARQLPPGRSLTEVSISAGQGGILVEDEAGSWNPESGQIWFSFACRPGRHRDPVALVTRTVRDPRETTAEGFFQLACELEDVAPEEAREAYRQVLELDPAHLGAHINIGRLYQDEDDHRRALDHYTAALLIDPHCALARYNVACAMEHLDRTDEAIASYLEALEYDPSLAEAHLRLASLYERQGRELDVLRHLKDYRTLMRSR